MVEILTLGYFGKMNSTLGSVVPLAMFNLNAWILLVLIDFLLPPLSFLPGDSVNLG